MPKRPRITPNVRDALEIAAIRSRIAAAPRPLRTLQDDGMFIILDAQDAPVWILDATTRLPELFMHLLESEAPHG